MREKNYGNTIDRGGLWHVSDAFVEQQSCRYFSVDKQSDMHKDSIVESLKPQLR